MTARKKLKAGKRTGRPRADVDVDRVLKLYLERKMTLRSIAKIVGVSHPTVARRILEELGQLRTWRMPGEH